jgi:ABC-type dipeptide/oligopeptide/nickel transport system permease component
MALAFVLTNFLVDLSYGLINPRMAAHNLRMDRLAG